MNRGWCCCCCCFFVPSSPSDALALALVNARQYNRICGCSPVCVSVRSVSFHLCCLPCILCAFVFHFLFRFHSFLNVYYFRKTFSFKESPHCMMCSVPYESICPSPYTHNDIYMDATGCRMRIRSCISVAVFDARIMVHIYILSALWIWQGHFNNDDNNLGSLHKKNTKNLSEFETHSNVYNFIQNLNSVLCLGRKQIGLLFFFAQFRMQRNDQFWGHTDSNHVITYYIYVLLNWKKIEISHASLCQHVWRTLEKLLKSTISLWPWAQPCTLYVYDVRQQ